MCVKLFVQSFVIVLVVFACLFGKVIVQLSSMICVGMITYVCMFDVLIKVYAFTNFKSASGISLGDLGEVVVATVLVSYSYYTLYYVLMKEDRTSVHALMLEVASFVSSCLLYNLL